MDTLTHALSGAVLARATASQNAPSRAFTPGRRVLVGFLAAAFPDSDVIVNFIDPLIYLNVHRGLTHSIIMLPLWALLLAGIFYWLFRRRYRLRSLFLVCVLAIGIHIAGDVITSYGTKILEPFSGWRVALPTTFIIDPYFTGILAAGLAGSWVWRRRARGLAQAGLACLVVYVGYQAVLYNQAIGLARAYVAGRDLNAADIQALPQPLSPYNWKIVVTEGDTYHVALVNLIRSRPRAAPEDAGPLSRLRSAYRPLDDLRWKRYERFGETPAKRATARSAWRRAEFEGYREFAALPLLYGIDRGPQRTCVWFTDLRFRLEGFTPPFRYGMCREQDAWRLRRMARFSD